MSFFQAFLIALIGYCGSIYGPWLLGTMGGWYTIGRPLIAGAIIGAILGDIKTGILIGAAIQALYIGLVTPGLSMPGDINFAAYIGIPLAIVSGASPEYAVSLSVPLSFLGVAFVYLVVTVNTVFVHKQEKWIEEGKFKLANAVPVFGNITNFIVRFFPILLANYYGAPYISKLVSIIPESLGNVFIVLGGMLPAVGFGLLLKFMLKDNIEILYFLFGFVLVSVFKISIIPATIIALLFAYMDIKYNKTNKNDGDGEVA
ncbi:PTS mannose/fructose/sorbose/N-acetylgalactosamine transporter subunit IIC [Sporanaerobacter acetigenes]|uniref:PTS system, mannose-specific IIC component n=1 Tax=Sporanaerobacter acetigenes DSM 13106 TaxID=1123281 RepID=A0A1M5T4D3_9FIRM|nr:PTS sugar transporter subunit IIC [Sporanaerobacter acetigenes]SHH45470.1 PTS system, mannose-specific IIC component [Sporanaerobacter acetigenes DSM 13106]